MFIDIIPPENETNTAITGEELRIERYVAEHHELPERLSDLPKVPGEFDRDVDGWGKPLVYAPQKDGSVVVGSPGKEGQHNARFIRFSIILPEDQADQEAQFWTYDNFRVIETSIRDYVATQHRLPKSLADIDIRAHAYLNDRWDGPIAYSPEADGSVILASHGKPGSGQVFSVQFSVPGVVSTGEATETGESRDVLPKSWLSATRP